MLSDFGTAITALALQVLIVQGLHGSAVDVGIVNGARWVAYPLCGLVAGLWIDRIRRRPVLIGSDLGRGVLLAVICSLALTDRLSVPVLAGLIAAFGLLSLGNDAAAQSYLPHLVPTTLLVRANARMEQSSAVAQTTGPALSGLLIKIVSAPVAIMIDAFSYLVSAAVTASIRVPESPPEPTTRRSARSEIAEGLRWVYRHPTLGAMGLNTHAWFFCWAVLSTVQASYALSGLGFPALTLGVVYAIGGVAVLVGTSLSEGMIRRWGEGRVMAISRWGYAPGTVIIIAIPVAGVAGPSWPAVALLVASQVVIGLAFGSEGPAEMSYRQAVTPARLQGRMNTTLRSANRTMIVIGAPVGGLLADRSGPRVALAVAAVGFLVVAVVFGRTRAATARYVPETPSG